MNREAAFPHPLIGFLLLIPLVACGPMVEGDADGGTDAGTADRDAGEIADPPPQSLVDASRAKVESVLEAAASARMILETLGLLPVYACGEARGTFVGDAAAGFEARHACATATAWADGPDLDHVTLSFDEGGCVIAERTFEGEVVFSYAGGTDRMDLSLDVSGLVIDGRTLDASGGYGVCGDETRYYGAVGGTLPGEAGTRFDVELQVASRAGPPIVGGTTLIVDGDATLDAADGTDTVTLIGLVYEVGDYLPKEGTIVVHTGDGHSVRVVFTPVLWSLGKAEITVDDYDPVTVPVLR